MGTVTQESQTHTRPPVWIHGAGRSLDFLLVCEHASAFIPQEYGDLGLSEAARRSHAAWDIGAQDLALALADRLAAPVVLGGVSRLVYDCNRPLEAPDSIPARSEIYDVPGNAALDPGDRQTRFDKIHTPFHQAITDQLRGATVGTVLTTIHTFTPVYAGKAREVEIGYLFHDDDRMASAALERDLATGRMKAALNEPYAARDGVTYTLAKHAGGGRLPNLMIEIRNDLADTETKAGAIAAHLAPILQAARAEVLA